MAEKRSEHCLRALDCYDTLPSDHLTGSRGTCSLTRVICNNTIRFEAKDRSDVALLMHNTAKPRNPGNPLDYIEPIQR